MRSPIRLETGRWAWHISLADVVHSESELKVASLIIEILLMRKISGLKNAAENARSGLVDGVSLAGKLIIFNTDGLHHELSN